MIAHKVYRFQLRPTSAEEHQLFGMAGARRFVYNWAIERRIEHYQSTGKSLSFKVLSTELTLLKRQPETAWLKEIDSQLLQQALRDADRAFQNFFAKRGRFPRFKSRKVDTPRFRIPQRVVVANSKVYIPKIGQVRIRQSQAVEGESKSATFKRDATGKWFVTLTVNFELPDAMLSVNSEKVAGIDLGLKTFAVLSNGEEIANQRFFRKGQKKLAKAQRQLSRKERHGANRTKAKQKVARVHRKIANQRNDFLHQLTRCLVDQYDGFCIEDLCIKGLARTKLAKSIDDAALGEFRRQLEYKTLWARKPIAVVSRGFPSSKMCGECGTLNDALTLSDRHWTCGCGAIHNRDLNAAKNIRREGLKQLAEGHSDSVNACGAGIRLMGATGDEARIPPL